MREVYRNPMLYYLVIPLLVGLWPLLVWGVYLPRAEQSREVEGGLCVEGQNYVIEILKIDPDRPNMQDKSQVREDFSYGSAVQRVANLCKIPASNCPYTVGKPIISGGKKRQNAEVKLTNVSISQAAKFLSTIQSMYVTLQCESVKLTRKKGMPDQWDVDFRFQYYY